MNKLRIFVALSCLLISSQDVTGTGLVDVHERHRRQTNCNPSGVSLRRPCEADRHALGRESDRCSVPIRCLLVGKPRSAFRVLFYIADDEVRVLAIRRPVQDLMKPLDLEL